MTDEPGAASTRDPAEGAPRRGDVATSRKRVDLQISQLEQSVARLARQREDALAAGQEDLASAGGQEPTSGEAVPPPEPEAASLEDELVQEIRELGPFRLDGAETEDRGGISAPPGLMELRPGAPDNVRAGLLFVVESKDTAVLLTYLGEPCGSSTEYQEAIRTAKARLPGARSGRPPACPASYTAYEHESFLDEFFPGEETEVEIGASALAARSRAHSLAEARRQIGLTQAQVARRMNIRQERISAIERAEPGATEIRTLAAYVRALGGRLEVIANIGDERIKLM